MSSRVDRSEIPALTGLRFIAAFLILCNHLLLYYVDLANPYLRHGLISCGFYGMDVFFILSGFIIHYNYGPSLAKPSWSAFRSFLVARFARLYPLYIVLIVLDLFLSWHLGNRSVADRWTALPFILTMTQSWFYQVLPTGALMAHALPRASLAWSISSEFFLYLLYPALAWALARDFSKPKMRLAMVAALVVGLSLALSWLWGSLPEIDAFGQEMFGTTGPRPALQPYPFGIWLVFISPYGRLLEFVMGALVAHAYRSMQHSPGIERASNILTVIAVGYLLWTLLPPASQADRGFPWPTNPATYFIFAFIVFAVAAWRSNWLTRGLSQSVLVRFGEYSYSIYLLQLFIGAAIVAMLGTDAPVIPKIAVYWLAILGCSALVYRYVERPARIFIRGRLARLPEPTMRSGS